MVTVNNKILVKRIQVRVNNILSDYLKDVFNGTNTVLAQRQLKSILRFLTNDGENSGELINRIQKGFRNIRNEGEKLVNYT